MFENVKTWFDINYKQQPIQVRWIMILTVSIFLPVYITVPVAVAIFVMMMRSDLMPRVINKTQHVRLLAVLGFLLLATPLIYHNYYGFACALLLCVYLVIQIYINYLMTGKLFDMLCSLICAISLICVFIAFAEKLLVIQDRVMALTYNPNFYAYMIEIIVLVCFYKFISTEKPIYILIFVANIAALLFTGCRSAWPAIIIGLLVFSMVMKKKNLMFILLLLGAAFVVAIKFEPTLLPRFDILDPYIANRLDIWEKALADFAQHPIFGRGLLGFYQLSHNNPYTPHAHNILFDLLQCTGLVGTGIFAFFLGTGIKQMAGAYRMGNEQIKARVALCSAVLAATLTHGITDMPIMGVHTGLLFIFIISLRPILAYEAVLKKEIICTK